MAFSVQQSGLVVQVNIEPKPYSDPSHPGQTATVITATPTQVFYRLTSASIIQATSGAVTYTGSDASTIYTLDPVAFIKAFG